MKQHLVRLIVSAIAFVLGSVLALCWDVVRAPLAQPVDVPPASVEQVTSVPVAPLVPPPFDADRPSVCALWPESRQAWAEPYDPKPPCRVCSGRTISKPIPAYPEAAKKAGVKGLVSVTIMIDEGGRPQTAQAASGHPLLREAAVRAACRARFTPTTLSGKAVKVSGIITYNFVLQ